MAALMEAAVLPVAAVPLLDHLEQVVAVAVAVVKIMLNTAVPGAVAAGQADIQMAAGQVVGTMIRVVAVRAVLEGAVRVEVLPAA
jgi:hypothetical protein